MEIRIRVFLLNRALKLAFIAGAALALQGCGLFGGKKELPPLGAEIEKQQGPEASEQPVINPEVTRRKIKVPRIGNQDFEFGAYVGVLSIEDFGTNSVTGLRLDYHVTEDFFLEASYGRSKAGTTSYERLSRSVPLTNKRYYSYYALNAGWDALPGEIYIGKTQAYNSAFYFTVGAGSTRFIGDDHFTVNAGMGYRILFSRVLTAHFDFRDYLFDTDFTTVGQKKVTHNLEGSLGLSVAF